MNGTAAAERKKQAGKCSVVTIRDDIFVWAFQVK